MKSFIYAPLFALYTLSLASPQPANDLISREPEPVPVPVIVGDVEGMPSPFEIHLLEKRKKSKGSSGNSSAASALDSPLPLIGAAVAGTALLLWV